MSEIEVDQLSKEFSRPDIRPGRFAGLRGLFTRRRKITRAVDGISFRIGGGELVGCLGPNGAGKSTTIKMLTGILTPTSGRATVAGLEPWRDRRRNAHNIGVVFGQRTQLWYDLPLRDSFEVIRDLYAVDPGSYKIRMAEFTELLGLDEFLDTPVRSLSLGQRMRGDLVAAMLYQPPVVFLDEPTVGLDVVAKERIREFVAETNARRGTTIILTTHDMDDVERLCHRVIIIDHGKILYEGGLDTLKRRYAPHRDLVVRPESEADLSLINSELAETVGIEDGAVTLRFDPELVPAPRLINDITSRFSLVDLSVIEPELEDVIRQLYTDRPELVGSTSGEHDGDA
ncbi:MAG TPA: ATP-binding cassette domain-containing protein [Microlunatus sp.]